MGPKFCFALDGIVPKTIFAPDGIVPKFGQNIWVLFHLEQKYLGTIPTNAKMFGYQLEQYPNLKCSRWNGTQI